ncbi:hypothetical protein G6F56_014011 [Rhizopus delemar]|nr:hypothetical protein G6F56_014011 [Rhizopus delemar]
MVWQNQRGDREIGAAVRKVLNRGIRGANDWTGAGLPEQTTLARGMELTALSNPLVAAIAARIRRAIVAGQGFHVYITLPVHPEGSLFDGAVLKQQYWVQQTLTSAK